MACHQKRKNCSMQRGGNYSMSSKKNARISYTELGQKVGLTSPAVTDRIRRMEDAGIISGYHAKVDLAKVGLPIMAVVRLGEVGGQSCAIRAEQLSQIEEVVECIRTTGDDSIIIKVVARSMDHLTAVLDQISQYGVPSTSIARADPMMRVVTDPTILHNELKFGG